jgi:hypothetical protein
VILRGGEAIGRLYVMHWAREHRIIEIALCAASAMNAS